MKIMKPVPAPADNNWQEWIDLLRVRPSVALLDTVAATLHDYLQKNSLKCFVLGISGGIDSSFLAALLHEQDIPFVGFNLPLSTSSGAERSRASAVAYAYTSSYGRAQALPAICDFTDVFEHIDARFSEVRPSSILARGNLQVRLRMMFLYHMAHTLGGCVLGTDQLDEFLTGFWTVHGDVGDVSPLQLLPKTTEYKLASLLLPRLAEPEPLQAAIEALPTDGLGISTTSFDQLRVQSYAELEAIFLEYFSLRLRQEQGACSDEDAVRLQQLTQTEPVRRFLSSSFKRRGSILFRPDIS